MSKWYPNQYRSFHPIISHHNIQPQTGESLTYATEKNEYRARLTPSPDAAAFESVAKRRRETELADARNDKACALNREDAIVLTTEPAGRIEIAERRAALTAENGRIICITQNITIRNQSVGCKLESPRPSGDRSGSLLTRWFGSAASQHLVGS